MAGLKVLNQNNQKNGVLQWQNMFRQGEHSDLYELSLYPLVLKINDKAKAS